MRFSGSDLDYLVATAKEAAASEILPRFHAIAAADISVKDRSIDVVTEADTRAEALIKKQLAAKFPGALIVGEESYEADKSIMDGLAEADLAFVIDPVDGTMNFIDGLAMFGTIIAVVAKGETIAGVLHDPVQNQQLLAVKGSGAFQRSADGAEVRAKTLPAAPISEMKGLFSWSFFPEPLRTEMPGRFSKFRHGLSTNCSVFDYWLLAMGKYHVMGNAAGQLWDHLAGVLIHQEAGGYVARFDGSPYDATCRGGNVLCAPDKDSWDAVMREVVEPPR